MAKFKCILDNSAHWELEDAYISKNQNLIIHLIEEFKKDCSLPKRKAIVSFAHALDFSFYENESDEFIFEKNNDLHTGGIALDRFCLYLANKFIEVVSFKDPTILIKAPYDWLKESADIKLPKFAIDP